jgi:hypothetical protein
MKTRLVRSIQLLERSILIGRNNRSDLVSREHCIPHLFFTSSNHVIASRCVLKVSCLWRKSHNGIGGWWEIYFYCVLTNQRALDDCLAAVGCNFRTESSSPLFTRHIISSKIVVLVGSMRSQTSLAWSISRIGHETRQLHSILWWTQNYLLL